MSDGFPWHLLGSIGVPVFIQIGALIYFLGTLKTGQKADTQALGARLEALSSRLDRLEKENESAAHGRARVWEHIQVLAVSVAKIEPQLDDIKRRLDLLLCEGGACPQAAAARRRKTMEAEAPAVTIDA